MKPEKFLENHNEHVAKLLNATEPSGMDKRDARLWKGIHWAWWLLLQQEELRKLLISAKDMCTYIIDQHDDIPPDEDPRDFFEAAEYALYTAVQNYYTRQHHLSK